MSREYYDDYRHGASRKRRKSLPGSVFNGVMLILSVAKLNVYSTWLMAFYY